MNTLACPRCTPQSWRRRAKWQAQPDLQWCYLSGGRVHLGAYCSLCGKWLSWVPQSDAWLRRAPALDPEWGAT